MTTTTTEIPKLFVARGRNRDDKMFVNHGMTREAIISLCMKHRVGKKDGDCILQGKLITGSTRRLAKNMDNNVILMVDVDTGEPIEGIVAAIKDAGLAAVIWSTYSHMKGETGIKETAYLSYLKKKGKQPSFDDAEILKDCVDYLLTDKKYEEGVLNGAVLRGRVPVEGGVEYVISHAPMPKYRVLFFLAEPFSFVAGPESQDERIKMWKAGYENVSKALDIPFDRSCVDPSRLMYLPAVPSSGATVYAEYIEGADLDFMAFVREEVPTDDIEAKINARLNTSDVGSDSVRNSAQPVTPGLLAFVAKYPDFDVLGWLQHIAPDDMRDGGPSGGATWTCPNEHNHSDGGTPEDKAFAVFIRDGAGSIEGWGLSCRHNTCIDASNNDRVWYLDALCVKYGVNDVESLKQFSDVALTEIREHKSGATKLEAAKALSSDTLTLDQKITALRIDSSEDDWNAVLDAVVHMGFPRDVPYINKICDAADMGVTAVKKALHKRAMALKKVQKAQDAVAGHTNTQSTVPPVNVNPEKGGRLVHGDWEWEDQIRVATAIFERENKRKPRVFRMVDKTVCRVVTEKDKPARIETMSHDQWFSHLTGIITYQTVDDMGRNKSVSISPNLVKYFVGTPLTLPELTHVSTTPAFDRQGNVITEPGYNAELKTYLHPVGMFKKVPDAPTEDDVDAAVAWLFEAVRDFPFSDAFAETQDPHRIYTKERGEDGYLIPNWERGTSSRINALSMILGPMIRTLFDGPMPAYHIDKAKPGTGAGYLVDVVSIIAVGSGAEVQTMSFNPEEFRKSITASLRDGDPVLFIDNINQPVDSGDLAAALTSGKWKDRVLGKSETIRMPVLSQWILAGNNVKFSSELLRRFVPVLLDAATNNPALDRSASLFKHNPLQKWLVENRTELVWSCHVLIKNWFVKGCPRGKNYIHSFDDWSRIMSGIFEAAGLDGFLDNRVAYLSKSDDRDGQASDLIGFMYANFGGSEFSAKDLSDYLEQDLELCPVNVPNADNRPTKLRDWLDRNLVGTIQRVPVDIECPKGCDPAVLGEKRQVKFVRNRTSTRRKFHLEAVEDQFAVEMEK